MIEATGYVYGRNWNFSYSRYSAIPITANSLKELKEIIETTDLNLLEDGYGFETVLGVHYTDITETIVEEKWTKTRSLKPIKRGQLAGPKKGN